MKKGDRRREEVIETAERLFYSRGYEKTSVQDILDEMHFSKGGFYHHFESKLQLLEAICEMRVISAKSWSSFLRVCNAPSSYILKMSCCIGE